MNKPIIKRYGEAFKRQVVSEYEAGATIPTLQKKYGIGGATTLPAWIKKYGTQGFQHELVVIQTAQEVQRIKELERQLWETEQALGRMVLEKMRLESTLEELQATYGLKIKKNAVPSSSASLPKSSTNVPDK